MNIDRIFAELELERSHLSGLGPDEAFETVMAALRDVEPIGLAWLYALVLMDREGGILMDSIDEPPARVAIAKRRLQARLRRAEAGK